MEINDYFSYLFVVLWFRHEGKNRSIPQTQIRFSSRPSHINEYFLPFFSCIYNEFRLATQLTSTEAQTTSLLKTSVVPTQKETLLAIYALQCIL